MTFAVVAFLLQVSTSAGPSGPEPVRDCQPCTFIPGDKLAPYSFTFEVKTNADGERSIAAIEVNDSEKKVTQRLPVDDMMAESPDRPFFFGHEDLNFDGWADLSLVTATGASNGYAQYWLFVPSSGRYKALGKHPILRLERKRHRLTSYETGGMAGLLYEANEYAFVGDDLVITRSEKQDLVDESKHLFRRELRVRKGDALVLVKTKTIKK